MALSPISGILERGYIPLVRTHFADEVAWQGLIAVLRSQAASELGLDPSDPAFEPFFVPVELPEMDSYVIGDLAGAWGHEDLHGPGHILAADERTMREQALGHSVTVLFVDLSGDGLASPARGAAAQSSFRCALASVSDVVANLEIGNIGFDEFAQAAADNRGVYST